jgi:glutamate racemase
LAEVESVRIGVFDSGLGGLSVFREIRRRLPDASLYYVADQAWVPYGARGEELIRRRARAIASFLTEHGADILVVACNTATAAAVPLLRETFSQPVVGMEPAVKPATAATRNGKVGVLATVGTLQSARFAALLDQFGAGIEVLTRACPGLVEQVEAAELDTEQTRMLVSQYVAPLINAGADTLVLGCTHFTFLRPLIQLTAGQDIQIIDTGAAVARRVAQVAEEVGAGFQRASGVSFWTSADPEIHAPALQKLWGERVQLGQLPIEYC